MAVGRVEKQGDHWPANCTLAFGFGFFRVIFARGDLLFQSLVHLGGKMAEKGSHLSRRSLLEISWRSLVVAGVARANRWIAFAEPAKGGLENATAESFAPYTGETFEFLKPAAERGIVSPTVELRLKTVSRHDHIARIEARMPAIRGKRKRESFSLLFELPGHESLGPGLHEFAQGRFKGCPIFLSRVLSPKSHEPILYEAVFG